MTANAPTRESSDPVDAAAITLQRVSDRGPNVCKLQPCLSHNHDWVVDLATRRVQRKRCADCPAADDTSLSRTTTAER